jgi:hypothetical protein
MLDVSIRNKTWIKFEQIRSLAIFYIPHVALFRTKSSPEHKSYTLAVTISALKRSIGTETAALTPEPSKARVAQITIVKFLSVKNADVFLYAVPPGVVNTNMPESIKIVEVTGCWGMVGGSGRRVCEVWG